MKFDVNDLVADLKRSMEAAITEVESWQKLPIETLDRKPAPDKWSANECLGHLLVANGHYVEEINKLKTTGKLFSRPARPQFKQGWLGGYFTRIIGPKEGEVKGKMKSPGFMDPDKNGKAPSNGSVVAEQFVAQTRQLIDLVEECRKADLNRVRVVTALGPLVKIKLGDAFMFVDAHTRRHLLQGRRAIEAVS